MSVWALQSTGLTGTIFTPAIATDGTQLVVGTDANEIATSPDGITWTLQASPFGSLAFPVVSGIAWSPDLGLFCALGFDQGSQLLWSSTSSDGVTWSAITQVVTGTWAAAPQWIGWGNGVFLIGGAYLGDGPAETATSPDGVSWTAMANPSQQFGLVFDGSLFVSGFDDGAGGYVGSTPDGTAWTDYTGTGFAQLVVAIGFNPGAVGPLAGMYAAADGFTNSLTQLSATVDFSAPTVVTTGLEGGAVNTLSFNPSDGTLIVAGNTSALDSRVAVTTDGTTWTLEDPMAQIGAGFAGGAIYALGQWFAYGGAGSFSIRGGGPPPAAIPDVTNTALAIAENTIQTAGYVVGAVTFAPSVLTIPGNVDSQSPVGGTIADLGTPVDLVISTGRASLLVPDLLGLTQPEAVALLLSVGLNPGAQSIAPSPFIESGFVMAQNPSPGTPIASGFFVSFIISSGPPLPDTTFNFEDTVISQYANSPTILQLAANMDAYIDQTANFANFYQFVWNVDTAVGFGLDIWGKIVDVSRLLQIPNTTLYVGFDNAATPPPDWQTMGNNLIHPPVGGAMYTGHNATETYLLDDDSYRQLILAKAFANIAATTAPAINQILQNLYGTGHAWVLNTGPMAISYNLDFTPSAIQLAILEQSGVIPTPPGVSVTIVTP